MSEQKPNNEVEGIVRRAPIVDYRKRRTEHAPILIDGAAVEQDENFKFHGVQLSWSKHKMVVKRARQSQFLRKLKGLNISSQILKRFYSCTSESSNCLASDRKAPEDSAYRPVHHWGQASRHPGPLYQD
jgi:hypothetical protein